MLLHEPVLLDEVIEHLNPQPGQNFIDGTLGSGGHSEAILKRTGLDGKLLGLDVDQKAIEMAKVRLEQFGDRVTFVNTNFKNIGEIYEQIFSFPVSGVLLDLGVSRMQLENDGYGISFQREEPLTMHLSGSGDGLTAETIVNEWSVHDLEKLFRQYGEEKHAKQIAQAIEKKRKKEKIITTTQLSDLIVSLSAFRRATSARPRKGGAGAKSKIHPATRVFQALRIAVNGELDVIKEALPEALRILEPGGRLAVISFHSLEDRIVKQFFRKMDGDGFSLVVKKPIAPIKDELTQNPRARSAKLRVIEKL